jgi:hypothetical protein
MVEIFKYLNSWKFLSQAVNQQEAGRLPFNPEDGGEVFLRNIC